MPFFEKIEPAGEFFEGFCLGFAVTIGGLAATSGVGQRPQGLGLVVTGAGIFGSLGLFLYGTMAGDVKTVGIAAGIMAACTYNNIAMGRFALPGVNDRRPQGNYR